MADLIERLRAEAQGQSTASRWLSEAKSRRQADNPTGEEIYAWLKSEETTAWEAAEEITRLRAELASRDTDGMREENKRFRRALESIATANDLWGTNGCIELRKVARTALDEGER